MRFYFFIIYFLSVFAGFSQDVPGEIKHALVHKYNIDYRVNYFDKMIFKVDVVSGFDNFFIPKLNYTNNAKSIFSLDESLRLRFSFDYKFLGLSYSFAPNFIPEVNNKIANTKTLDLSFKFFYSDRLRQEVIYKKTRGFTLLNPDDLNSIAVFNNLEINTFGGKTFYIANNNFSYRAYESQTERQTKSAGSLIPAFSYFLTNLYPNNPNQEGNYLERIKSLDFILQFGYMYNYAINKTWFITGGVHPGVGINQSESFYKHHELQSVVVNDKVVSFNVDFNLSLAYNHENFFSGLRTNYKNYQYDSRKTSDIMNTKFNSVLFLGYRFAENKKIKKAFERIEKNIEF